ncbi:YesK family protein [Gottfriedia sp. OAE603]|uniref:YesK family protein n=1 Tax=Gottfriedia sp. OAE603 TaxID=2663872 RepID=UPI001789E609
MILIIPIIAIAFFIFVINIISSKKTLKRVFLYISLICLIVLLFSIFGVGRWAGMGIGICTMLAYLGISIGFIITALFQKKNETISK